MLSVKLFYMMTVIGLLLTQRVMWRKSQMKENGSQCRDNEEIKRLLQTVRHPWLILFS